MADTSIEWTQRTWNPIVGCSRVSRGCEHCYAERVAHRGMAPQHRGLTVVGKHGPRWTGEVRFLAEKLDEPLRWRKPSRVFVNSMSDLFHEGVTDEQIDRVFAVMQASPQHTFQVLTKRPERARAWARGADERVRASGEELAANMRWCHAHEDGPWPLPNVWLGVSVEDQATADERIPLLLECHHAVRWVSYEPALGMVDFRPFMGELRTCGPEPVSAETRAALAAITRAAYRRLTGRSGIDWVVIGGESGPGARPFDLAWARSTIAQCHGAGVPVFFKQAGARPIDSGSLVYDGAMARQIEREGWAPGPPYQPARLRLRDRKGGDMAEWPEGLRVREYPEARRG